MNGFLIFLMIAAMVAVVVSLGLGLFGMVKGGEFNKKYGNKFMQARVGLQALALVLLVIIFSYSQK